MSVAVADEALVLQLCLYRLRRKTAWWLMTCWLCYNNLMMDVYVAVGCGAKDTN